MADGTPTPEQQPAPHEGGEGRSAPEVHTNPPSGEHDAIPHAQSAHREESQDLREKQEREGLTTAAESKIRENLEAKGYSQEDIDNIVSYGGKIAAKLKDNEELLPEDHEEGQRLAAELSSKHPNVIDDMNNELNRAFAEEMAPPSPATPDDISEITEGEHNPNPQDPTVEQGEVSQEKSKEEKAQEEAKKAAMEEERLAREAYEAIQAAKADPLDVDKQRVAAEAIMHHKKHHDAHDKKHGADALEKGDPYWAKLLKGLGIAFYLYIGMQYLAAEIVYEAAKGASKG